MNTKEAAEFLGIAPATLRRHTDLGNIPGKVLPGKRNHYIYFRAALESYVMGREVPRKYKVNFE